MQQIEKARRGQQPLDIGTMQELVDAKLDINKLVGLRVDWHGTNGVVVRRKDGDRIVPAISVRVPCDRRCGRRIRLSVVSGVHKGAFCIVVDKRGNRVADLRDKVSVCGHCAK
jgi:hypothetical protein